MEFFVGTEWKKLEAVMVRRPGAEVERITPENMAGLLFDDIPYLWKMREEHEVFKSNFSATRYYRSKGKNSIQRKTINGGISFEQFIKQVDPKMELLATAGGGEARHREQWNDGTNVFAIGPRYVLSYKRNEITNACLRDRGVTVLEVAGSELVRGRGGPRCMTMPLRRSSS